MAETMAAFTNADGMDVTYRVWPPADSAVGVVVIAHGASEHSGRYARFAEFLNGRGWAAYAVDHQGHGETAKVTGVGKTGPRGWSGMIDDLHQLVELAGAEHPGRPVVLFGHSMGSFLAQGYIQRFGEGLAGVVLSGSSGGMADVTETVAALDAMVADGAGDQPAPIFGPLNAGFEPARTPFDWLSRDPDEVDRYVADPLCGDEHPLTIAYVAGMLRHSAETWSPDNEARIPRQLPVLLITGEEDPVSQGAATVHQLEERYRQGGMTDVTAHYYSGARHELLNEINRDDVHADVAAWLDRLV